uniref:ABC transporter substrate-binding protein n=1 Tax=Roseovarius sp. BRH_c41 TaxID=1629709 RepID=UPI0025FFB77D|nr:ABC transporter substrate-binding protein [Roseovarius sp. BRH_c41]
MVDAARIGRRAFLGGMMALWGLPAQARGPRLAAIDWAMLETAMALGVVPVAACELIRYRADAVRPEIPAQTVDLGLRGSPNFELLQLTRPDLILSSPYYTGIAPRLGSIAEVMSLPFYIPGESPWPKAMAALHALADRLDLPHVAARVAAETEAELAAHARRLTLWRDRPVYVIEIGDARHVRAFGADSMFGAVLEQLGLENAWSRSTRFAFAAPLPLERLAERPEARIVLVSDIPIVARRALARSVLWNRLGPVANGRVSMLGEINPFGGVPAGLRFARLMTTAAEAEQAG